MYACVCEYVSVCACMYICVCTCQHIMYSVWNKSACMGLHDLLFPVCVYSLLYVILANLFVVTIL